MSGIQIADAKAPWIMFERRAVEDRTASISEGRYVAKDLDFVLVTPHGSKDQIEREVQDWLSYNEQQVREGRLDPDWLRQYRNAYENWKAGKEIPVEGTPILNWPLVSPAQVKMLQDLHILTVEVLSGANEETIRRLGMGGRNLVQRAQDYLKQVKDHGKATQEMGELRSMVDALLQTNKTLQESNELLRLQVGAIQGTQPPVQSPESRQSQNTDIGLDDLVDKKVPAAPASLTKL